MDDPSYELKIRQTLTIKPTGFKIKARKRPGKDLYVGIVGTAQQEKSLEHHAAAPVEYDEKLAPLAVFYGSNQGTCKKFAESLQSSAPSRGFHVTIGTLDSATENLPRGRPVIFIAPSYEGQPPDNGRHFVSWLKRESKNGSLLDGVKYAVFGVGNPDWV